LEDRNQVAVKKLRERIAKIQREFEAEVNALGKIRQICFLGRSDILICLLLGAYYWRPKDEKLLVFDFMPGGSLATFVHGIFLTQIRAQFDKLRFALKCGLCK